MNKLIKLFTIIALAVPTMALADSTSINSGIVTDHYKTVIQQNPYGVEVCREVSTSSGGASTGDVIVGAVIGGAIGNQIGKGKGNDAATILGAILGADIVNKKNPKQSGTATQCYLETRYTEVEKRVYSHSTIVFLVQGKQYKVDFIK